MLVLDLSRWNRRASWVGRLELRDLSAASASLLPTTWRNDVTRYLPSVAGQAVIGPTKFTPPGHLLSPWTGFTVFCGYAAVVLFAAAITRYQRDA